MKLKLNGIVIDASVDEAIKLLRNLDTNEEKIRIKKTKITWTEKEIQLMFENISKAPKDLIAMPEFHRHSSRGILAMQWRIKHNDLPKKTQEMLNQKMLNKEIIT